MSAAHHAQIPQRYVSAEAARRLTQTASAMPVWDLTARQVQDLVLLANGGFYPLRGFMTQADYVSVLSDQRLDMGHPWPMPITLDVSAAFADGLEPGVDIALRSPEGWLVAIMSVTDRWSPDKTAEAQQIFGSTDPAHPGVEYLLNQTGAVYLGGPVSGIAAPSAAKGQTPNELRSHFKTAGWDKALIAAAGVSADAAEAVRARLGAGLLDQGADAPADSPEKHHHSVIDLALRGAGARDGLWQVIVARNHGLTHIAFPQANAPDMPDDVQAALGITVIKL